MIGKAFGRCSYFKRVGATFLASAAIWCVSGHQGAKSAEMRPPVPEAFRTTDGAYFISLESDRVDPYFVNKSLIIGMQAGMDLRTQVNDWLRWLLPWQRKDGGFDRYCGGKKGRWKVCDRADADDSMAATFIQLVAMAKARQWIDAEHLAVSQSAVKRANVLLRTLHNPGNGLYRVFPREELYYLMDSAEVLEALLVTKQTKAADRLAQAIRSRFWSNGEWQPSIPAYKKAAFYPHVLAPVYLWDLPFAVSAMGASNEAAALAWVSKHSADWLSRKQDRYAWGLVAWQLRRSSPVHAGCWRKSLRPFSAQIGFTVLDAFIDQALDTLAIQPDCPVGLMFEQVS